MQSVRLGAGPEVLVCVGGEGDEGGLRRVGREQEFAGAADQVALLEGCDGFLDRLRGPEHIGHRARPAHPLEDDDVEHLELGASHGYSQRYLELRRSAFSEKGR
jgi:hypothetical protein